MSKVRIYDLAKELKLESKKILEDARRIGVDVSVPSHTLDDNIAAKIREMYYPTKEKAPPIHKSRLLNDRIYPLPRPDKILIKKARKTRSITLTLSRMSLTKVDDDISQLSDLRVLYLNGNQLTSLPESIGDLSLLQHLDASGNQLASLPESIGRLSQLQHLDVSNNRLKALPDSIGQMSQLRYLDVSNNQLSTLPESIGNLSQLEYLLLGDNQLIALPDSIQELAALKEIYLQGNKELDLPPEVLGHSWQDVFHKQAQPTVSSAILEYYSRVRSKRLPLNEAKLILVGRGGVGKTSIVNQLVHRSFNQDEKKTEGISITAWDLTINDDENIRLNVWDFGGQEIMHATHQFFLTQRSLYLLALNGREGAEDADADYWLKLIESFGDESPIIVVLNKIKEHPFDLNRRALQQKYPAIRDFIKTDCEDGTGISELHELIKHETDRLEHLRDAFPASWFKIKDELAGTKRNYMSLSEYCDVCRRYGERDKAAQKSLVSYLHNLGIVLNYKDDPRLQDTHVLNPHWVTNGIYRILNSEKLERQKGEIKLNDLSAILDETDYPPVMHRFIFDLMKKFELCFSFPDNDALYLIPELLDKQEPEEAAAFNPDECLNFQYHYPVLPEGLFPRFIVRTRALSEGSQRWRTGVILTFEDCRALVKADAQDKKVFIQVSGPISGRRRLLAIIRSDFERIHHDIPKLLPRGMVPVPNYPNLVVLYDDLQVMERKERRKFTQVADDEVIDLDVRELLNGVDLEGARQHEDAFEIRERAVSLFISYSHKDEHLRIELDTHLKLLQRVGVIDAWHDRRIDAGDEWKRAIDDNLERADIILLLVSADFIASDYCYEKEMTRALERHDNNEARAIPIVVRDVNWGKAPFAKLQALPKDGKPITDIQHWPNKDSAWRNVADGIEKIADQIRKR